MEFLLVELRAERRLGFLAQAEQPRVAVKIAVGLARRAESEPLHFFLGEGMAEQHVLLQHGISLRRRDLADAGLRAEADDVVQAMRVGGGVRHAGVQLRRYD